MLRVQLYIEGFSHEEQQSKRHHGLPRRWSLCLVSGFGLFEVVQPVPASNSRTDLQQPTFNDRKQVCKKATSYGFAARGRSQGRKISSSPCQYTRRCRLSEPIGQLVLTMLASTAANPMGDPTVPGPVPARRCRCSTAGVGRDPGGVISVDRKPHPRWP